MTMWLTMEQAAEVVGVSTRTIAKYRQGLGLPVGFKPLRASSLPFGRVIRIKDVWVDEFIEQFAAQESIVEQISEKLMAKLKRGSR